MRKILIFGADADEIREAITATLHQGNEDIIIISHDDIQENQELKIKDAMIPYLGLLEPYIQIASFMDSNPPEFYLKTQKSTDKKIFHHINTRPLIKNRSNFIQKRHIPTNRGK